MKIACIGWGSLLWNPEDLLIDQNWHPEGPLLPIEFLRKSDDGRLTLVICGNFPLVPTLWCEMTTENLSTALESLRVREKCMSLRPIGVIQKKDPVPEDPIKNTIHAWLQTRDLDAVIWTNLGPRFNDTNGRIPKLEEALDYLANLPQSRKKLAEEYIRKAPASVNTVYRKAIQDRFGWTPLAH